MAQKDDAPPKTNLAGSLSGKSLLERLLEVEKRLEAAEERVRAAEKQIAVLNAAVKDFEPQETMISIDPNQGIRVFRNFPTELDEEDHTIEPEDIHEDGAVPLKRKLPFGFENK